MDIVPRFWSKVDKSSDCWLWMAGRNLAGYGQFTIMVNGSQKHKIVTAHRVAYELTYGPIPEGMIICHRCNNRQCVNPSHLYVGTPQDNANDRAASGQPRKEKSMTTPRTINLGKVNSYIVQKTIGGYVVVFLNEDRSIRNVDGGKLHKSRQNAYNKVDRLNNPIKYALKKYGMAEAEYGSGYIANVQDDRFNEFVNQYSLTLRQGMMPPFETKFFGNLEDLEQYAKDELPQPLKWSAVKPEEI